MQRHAPLAPLALLLLPLLLVGACRDKSGPGRVLTSIVITPANPSVADGATVQLSATLRDQNGQAFTTPPAGVTLTWSSADAATASVSGAGLVTGERPGQTQITAAAGGVSASTQMSVTQVATTLELVGGSGKQAVEGTELPDSLKVRVTDRHGSAVAGVSVQFVVTGGGGSISPATASTDAAGHALAVWTLGAAAGTNTAEARAQGLAGSPVTFTAEGAPVAQFSEGHQTAGMRSLVYHEGRFYHAFHDNSTGSLDVYLRTSQDGVNWTPRVRVSDAGSGNQLYGNVAVWGSGAATRVAVLYADHAPTNPQLRVAVSTDGGQTFGPSVPVSHHTDNSSIFGSIAVDRAGALYAAWVRLVGSSWGQTWFSRSTDGGASWSTPAVAFNNGRPFNHETHIAAGEAGQVWIVTAADQGNVKNLVVSRSMDGGGSWSQSQVTNYGFGFQAEKPSLLYAPDGTLYVVWHDRQGVGQPWRIRVSRSTDAGATWSASVRVSDEIAMPQGEYNWRARSSLALRPDGTLYAVWADEREGSTGPLDSRNYDIYLSRSTDGGASWSADERVNDRPEVPGQTQSAITAGPGGALVVWEDERFGPRRLLHRLVP